MWWEELAHLNRTCFSAEDVDAARKYMLTHLEDALPKSADDIKNRNHFVVNWFSQGLGPLAWITHLGLVIRALDQAIYPEDKPKLQKKIRSLVRLQDQQLESLYAEFLVSKFLLRRFAPIGLEPTIEGTKRKADFLVHYDGEPVLFDVSRLVVRELLGWQALQHQLINAMGRMAVKRDLDIEVAAVLDFIPRPAETDHVKAAVLKGLQEIVDSGGNEINVAVSSGRGIRLMVNRPKLVKDGDETWLQGRYGRLVRQSRAVATKGYVAMFPSIDGDVLARFLGPRLQAKIERTARDKLHQRRPGKPFILVLNLDTIPGAHENRMLVHDMIMDTLARHPKLSAVTVFRKGTPFYKDARMDEFYFVFAEERCEAALPTSFFDYFVEPFGPLQ